jgi:hypothetical protein
MLDNRTGEVTRRQIVAEGAGLGYFGRQSIAVARALSGQVPHLYGFADGLLYRDWLPPGPVDMPDGELAGTIAGYVTTRQAALPAAGRHHRPAGRPGPGLGGHSPAAVGAVRAGLAAGAPDPLGYPATSPSGALALRALIAHGYRPVLATGRSLPEVRDRCTVFGLAGGVAEYGSALVCGGEAAGLLPPDGRAVLEAVREELSGLPGVVLDSRYRHLVRARAAGGGPLPADLAAGLVSAARPEVRLVGGQGQTDFAWAGADKGTGLRALAARLSQPGCALAVGDTAADLPMFETAALARAPRNARLGAAGGGIRLTRHAYQAGLLDACADLLGHRPGRCPACYPPAFSPRAKAMLALLGLRAGGLGPGRHRRRVPRADQEDAVKAVATGVPGGRLPGQHVPAASRIRAITLGHCRAYPASHHKILRYARTCDRRSRFHRLTHHRRPAGQGRRRPGGG